MTIADHKVHQYCPHQACAGLHPDKFRFNRKEVNNMDFLDKSKIFDTGSWDLGRQSEIPSKRFESSHATLVGWQIETPVAMTK